MSVRGTLQKSGCSLLPLFVNLWRLHRGETCESYRQLVLPVQVCQLALQHGYLLLSQLGNARHLRSCACCGCCASLHTVRKVQHTKHVVTCDSKGCISVSRNLAGWVNDLEFP